MKRNVLRNVILYVVVLALLCGLCACGKRAEKEETEEPEVSSRRVRRDNAAEASAVTPEPAPEATPEPTPEPAPEPPPEPTPEPEPTPDPYYQDLLDKIAAYDARILLPELETIIAPEKQETKYVQGEFGQGVGLFAAPTGRDRLGIIEEGVSVTVLCVREGRALVLISDGRYGWAPMDRLVYSFDANLSYVRKKDYLISNPDKWTSDYWRGFILSHQDDLPAEVVRAAKGLG